jgi:hypothetical protein
MPEPLPILMENSIRSLRTTDEPRARKLPVGRSVPLYYVLYEKIEAGRATLPERESAQVLLQVAQGPADTGLFQM